MDPNSNDLVPLPSLSLPPTPAASTAPPAAASSPSPIQDDDDVIEKDWVNKAKQIIEQTKNDPYKQAEELTLFKADYMKKRYNKIIKVDK